MKVVVILALSLQVYATSDSTTTRACQDVQTVLQGKLLLPGQPNFVKETKNYWSEVVQRMKPACIVQPTSASDVSEIVKILQRPTNANVKFAIKSGGHNANPGMSGCNDCVVIALGKLRFIKQNRGHDTVEVGPGGTWQEVAETLAEESVQAVGGRYGSVGIGGYLAQGGLSFFSAQHGMASDNVVEFETVMSNGSIVTVNTRNHPELMQAIRGSGDQFGIHTKYTLKTHQSGRVWGGARIYDNQNNVKEFQQAFHEFVARNDKDPKAAIILVRQVMGKSQAKYALTFFYDGAEPPESAFGQLIKIPSVLDKTASQSYPDLLTALSTGLTPPGASGLKTNSRTITIPYIPDQPEIYRQLFAAWENVTRPYAENGLLQAQQFVMQPIPDAVGKASDNLGKSAWGLASSDKNRLVMLLDQTWRGDADDSLLAQMATRFLDEIKLFYTDLRTRHYAAGQTGKLMGPQLESYLPLFMNDASTEQPVIQSFKAYDRFKALKQLHDPTGLWSRTGGFKY